MGNRMGTHDLASRGATNFTRDNNGLNQYASWTPSAINYDDDMGGEWGSPGHANGVTMQEGWITASYNALNQPMGMWCRTYGSNFLWFGYDPLGRCVKRWMGTATGYAPNSNLATYYYYDGVDMIQEGSSALSAARIYVHGAGVDQIAASQVVSTGEWRYHHYDGQGNCILLTDTSGNIREQYDYDAFGLPYVYNVGGATLAASPWGNRFLFTGREWLSDLRIYDYRARQYQPELGRFLQPDPKEFAAGDYNLYRYCHNDPVNKSDPTGLQQITASTWNHLMYGVSGSLLSSRGFDLWKQGSVYLSPLTGNYKDTKVANHVPTKGEIGSRSGGTIYDLNLGKTREVAGVLVIEPSLNWYVQRDYVNTNVVTRELEHVNRWLWWQGEGDGGAAVRSFNKNPSEFNAIKAKLKQVKRDEDRWQEDNIHKNFRHQLDSFPEKKMDPTKIKEAIENVRPIEEPYLGHQP
jgi:RHS repeat-associated protein